MSKPGDTQEKKTHGLCTQNSYNLDKNSVTDNFNVIGEGPL